MTISSVRLARRMYSIAIIHAPPALAVRLERDASLGTAEAERAVGTSAQRNRARRVEIEQLDVGAIAPGDRADAERHVGAEVCLGNLVDALATRNDGLQRCWIE